jgi:hypothetical protein
MPPAQDRFDVGPQIRGVERIGELTDPALDPAASKAGTTSSSTAPAARSMLPAAG